MTTETSFPTDSVSLRTSSRRLRISLGTWVAIEATADSASAEQVAIDAAYAAISEVDRRMHPHRAGSDLARINAAQLQTPLEIQPSTWRLLKLAKRLHALTDTRLQRRLGECRWRSAGVRDSKRSDPAASCG
jgi:thiamine biosynthesis lipoprotein ApbE